MEFFTYKIVDERGGGTGNISDPQKQGDINPDNPMSPLSSALSAGNKSLVSLATIQKIGSTVMSFGSSHIATYTGSTALQERVNAGAQAVGTAISIIDNPVAGIASLALSLAKRAMEVAEEKRKDNLAVTEARKRAGVSFNTSRM